MAETQFRAQMEKEVNPDRKAAMKDALTATDNHAPAKLARTLAEAFPDEYKALKPYHDESLRLYNEAAQGQITKEKWDK